MFNYLGTPWLLSDGKTDSQTGRQTDRPTDGHTTTAYTVLAYSSAVAMNGS